MLTMSYFAIYLMLRTAKKKTKKPPQKQNKNHSCFKFFSFKKNEIIKQSCSDRKKNVIELVRFN